MVRKEKVEKACVTCGKMFMTRTLARRYCCEACRPKSEIHNTKLFTKVCDLCGKEYQTIYNRSRYCSEECRVKCGKGKDWYTNVCFNCQGKIGIGKAFCKKCWDNELKATRIYDFKYCDTGE